MESDNAYILPSDCLFVPLWDRVEKKLSDALLDITPQAFSGIELQPVGDGK